MMRDTALLFGDRLHRDVQLMVELGFAMADERLPAEPGLASPQKRIDRCIQALKDAAGEEVLANAAGIIAMFTAMTMVVDATGQTSKEMPTIQKYASKFLRWKRNLAAFCPCIQG